MLSISLRVVVGAVFAVVMLCLSGNASADKADEQVTFTCSITGSGDSGFDIYATNDGPDPKKCSATCTVTKRDGSKQSWSYSNTVPGNPGRRFWFGGEASVRGAPLSNPTISNTSCN